MYKEVLRSIENIEIYPVISLVIFVAFFLGMFVWVLRVPKSHIEHMENLPIDEDENLTSQQQ
ncbi:cbb3-type cytochrome c oxidase subunit 3 [Algoriphagus sp. C2-7]|uniref:Cbb3-type cytochrome c oxidase subunit 3 n=1 Tax=Algoriphagus sediminis TaxID=3057113 RepID=A0ABT7Y9F6_9BACT|nr:cbb3-type cytochrome c oxidase subunit 3 [Algoriphagus sediminis]MDN3203149.1 cbb3-type cytochrome c oxidase subunit 3 [Algoriphagus sediminis]